METLTALDAGFLEAENADPRTSLAIGALAVLEGPIPDHRQLAATLAERIGRCPRFRQRPRRRPLDLGAPEWVDVDDFDIANHVRRLAVPAPGEDRQLHALVAEIMSWRLDRSRPLWEIWLLDGLSGDRWAMLMKVHHCIADGVATAHMLTGLSDNGFGDDGFGHTGTAPKPLTLGALRPALNPATWVGTLRDTVRGLRDAAGLPRPGPSPSLNGPLTNLRRYSAARVRFNDVRRVCEAFDVTVNDVALAALTESYRTILLRRGRQPAADTLRTLVPVSQRGPGAVGGTGNRLSLMLPYLPVDDDNPVRRLRTVHARLCHTKAGGQPRAANLATSTAAAVPFALTSWAVRVLTRLPQHGVATLATNIPGPREPLEVMGCPVTQVLPVPPLAMQLQSGAAILSYADELVVGILADFDAVPEVDELARGVEIAVARLLTSAKRRRSGRDRHGLSLVAGAG